MPPGAPQIEIDWLRVQRLLQQQRARLDWLAQEAARGADVAPQVEAARRELEGVEQLAEAVRARLAAATAMEPSRHFHRQDYSILVVDDH